MTHSDLVRRRLRNQRIEVAPLGTAREVVDWLVAVQAQDYAGAKWALGLRMQGATDGDVERAFADGAILRTHVMRPTWHFVAPPDIRWLLALTAPRVHAVNATMYRKLALDRAILRRSNDELAKALEGGKQLTRDELREALERAGIAVDSGLRLAYFMMSAELDGVICSGARRGKQFTYALLDERVPDFRVPVGEEALVALVLRYFMSRGPATVQDFAKWSGLTIADARRGLEAVKSQFQQEMVDGQTYWYAASLLGDVSSPVAHLLSVYDEYISSYKDHSILGTPEAAARLAALGNDLSYIVVVDGRVVGVWKRTVKKNAVMIESHLFAPLTPAEDAAIALAAQQYGAFLQLPAVLSPQG
jgi:hypothetical protein